MGGVPTADEWIAMLHAYVIAVVIEHMCKDLDVTDDVLGREVHSAIHARVSGTGTASVQTRAAVTPIKATQWASGIAANIRYHTALGVAVALDEDPGADEQSIGRWVYALLLRELGEQHKDVLIPEFAYGVGKA